MPTQSAVNLRNQFRLISFDSNARCGFEVEFTDN